MTLPLIVQPLRPRFGEWEQWPVDTSNWPAQPYAIERWYNRSNEVQVVSAVEVVQEIGRDNRPEYHLSVSGLKHLATTNYRCSNSRALWALRQFGLQGWEEDNHVPGGLVRNFWRPIAEPLVGQQCLCKAIEPEVSEDRGDYIWRHAPSGAERQR